MKKLLCVLMFGMVFGQDAITTREYEIPFNSEMTTIDISQYAELGDGLYEIDLILQTIDNINTTCNQELYYPQWRDSNNYGVIYLDFNSWEGQITYGWDSAMPAKPPLISSSNPILTLENPDANQCFNFSGNWLIRVTGRFNDTDVGLQGDMNDDGELDVLDVVSLVQEILGGGMGNVGDLLNIVTG